ncbi:MAG: hypothetical protein ABI573_02965 [Chloroflexota bacterium]
MRPQATIAALTLVLAACVAVVATYILIRGPASDPVVDGWAIGSVSSCSVDVPCDLLIDVATKALDNYDRGHAAIVRVTIHDEGHVADALGRTILMTRSGGAIWVARFELADRSVRAIGVGHVGVSPEVVALQHGPN